MVTKKTLRKLRKKGWTFHVRWMKKHRGLCRFSNKTLSVNAYTILASVIIHEATHAEFPHLPEELVGGVEKYERRRLTLKRAKGIVKTFCPDICKALEGR